VVKEPEDVMRTPLHRLSAAALVLAVAGSSVGVAAAQAAAPDAGRSATPAVPSRANEGTTASNYQNQFSCIPDNHEANAVQKPTQPPGETAAHAPNTSQIITAGKNVAPSLDIVISHYQHSGNTSKADCSNTAAPAQAQPNAPASGALKGKTRTFGAGVVTPVVQAGRSYAPPKPTPKPKPDTSNDDCMSCDD